MRIHNHISHEAYRHAINGFMDSLYGNTVDVECIVISSKMLNLHMQPSQIHLKKELTACEYLIKNATGEAKKLAKVRAKEIEQILGLTSKALEKASIATDEQDESPTE
jgi:hypothetical protein